MRLLQVDVTKLFGLFHHTISINTTDSITIIHGPNGYGKTIILHLINALFHSTFSDLRSTPFHTFTLTFDDGSRLVVIREVKKDKDTNITVQLASRGMETVSYSPRLHTRPSDLEFPLGMIEDLVPDLERTALSSWLHRATGEVLGVDQVVERYGQLFPPRHRTAVPEWLEERTRTIPVRIIETQRLLSSQSARRTRTYDRAAQMIPTVTADTEELAAIIQRTLAEYGTLSQSLDRSFPSRVVRASEPAELSNEQLTVKLRELEEKRTRLTEAGLLDRDNDPNFEVPQHVEDRTRGLLSVYVSDTEQKLGVFDNLYQKVELLQRSINDKFHHKTLYINKAAGFLFRSDDGTTLAPTNLSSGEQHELVLLYELLFKVSPGSLIMIDTDPS